MKADILTLASALQSPFARLLTEGKSLTIPISCFMTQYQPIPAMTSNVSIAIVRSLTRLKGLPMTYGAAGTLPLYFPHPDGASLTRLEAGSASDSLFNVIVSVGSKRYTEKNCDSFSWLGENLKKSAGNLEQRDQNHAHCADRLR